MAAREGRLGIATRTRRTRSHNTILWSPSFRSGALKFSNSPARSPDRAEIRDRLCLKHWIQTGDGLDLDDHCVGHNEIHSLAEHQRPPIVDGHGTFAFEGQAGC